MPEHSAGEPLREVAAELVGKDGDAVPEILRGTDFRTGMSHSFEIGTVESVPLRDSNGKLIGVKFPAQHDNVDSWVRWANADERTSDRGYGVGVPIVTPNPNGNGVNWELPDSRDAPWDTGGQPPTYVFAHGIPDGTVLIRASSADSTSTDFAVDGKNFGRILAANNHYRQAIEDNSQTTVSAICYGDASADQMTEQLWESGVDTDVFSFKVPTLNWSVGPTQIKGEASTLSVTASNPSEEQHLADPITHRVPPRRTHDGA